jgi:septal ring factor EnvC (AmiA/AmiB activator)
MEMLHQRLKEASQHLKEFDQRLKELEAREAARTAEAERQMGNLDALLLALEAHGPEPTADTTPLSDEFLSAMMDFDDE